MSVTVAEDLRAVVAQAHRALSELDEAAAGRAPAPGKWSPKELVGHLIDSAAINHQRFAQAADRDNLVFDTYDQDRFVALQRPGEAAWSELLELWRLQNLHLARLIERLPEDALTREHTRHNLHQIAFETVPVDQAATLEYFVRDYVAHLRHHLRAVGC